MFAGLQNEDAVLVFGLVCMLVCMHSDLPALLGYRWDSVFCCPLLLYLICQCVAELHLQVVSGNFGAQKSGKMCSSAAEAGCLQCIPSCEKFQLPFIQQPELPALSLANSAMQLPEINAKRFWHKKTKSVGTAQTKLNCKTKRAQAILQIVLFSSTFI